MTTDDDDDEEDDADADADDVEIAIDGDNDDDDDDGDCHCAVYGANGGGRHPVGDAVPAPRTPRTGGGEGKTRWVGATPDIGIGGAGDIFTDICIACSNIHM